MTKECNKKLQIFKCSCGMPFRGDRFRRHVLARVTKGEMKHDDVLMVMYCVWCDVRCSAYDVEFVKAHANCPLRVIGKEMMSQVLSGERGSAFVQGEPVRSPVVNVDLDDDEVASKVKRKLIVESDDDDDDEAMESVVTKKGCVERLSDDVELERAVASIEPLAKPRAQSSPRDERVMPNCVVRVSQSSVPSKVVLTKNDALAYGNVRNECDRLQGKLNAAKCTLKEVTVERDRLKRESEDFASVKRELFEARQKLVNERKLRETLESKLESCEKSVCRERELKEEAMERVRVLERQLSMQSEVSPETVTALHIPVVGYVPERPLIYGDVTPDTSQECFNCTDVRCYHIKIHHKEDIRVDYRKPHKFRKYYDWNITLYHLSHSYFFHCRPTEKVISPPHPTSRERPMGSLKGQPSNAAKAVPSPPHIYGYGMQRGRKMMNGMKGGHSCATRNTTDFSLR